MLWIGRVLSLWPVFIVVMSATWKLTRNPWYVREITRIGWSDSALPLLAFLQLGSLLLYVIPQTGHGLTGSSYTRDGDGQTIPSVQIPSRFDRVAMLLDWVEKGTAPPKSATVTGNGGSLPLCSYPTYPKYTSGLRNDAASYTCATP